MPSIVSKDEDLSMLTCPAFKFQKYVALFAPSLFDSLTATARPAKLSGKDMVCVVAAGTTTVTGDKRGRLDTLYLKGISNSVERHI